jgi:adenosylmethionine-8-amino-7-oxononanoate aminotransferase
MTEDPAVGIERQTSAIGHLWAGMISGERRDRDDLCLESAAGVRLTFADGSERLDGTSGLWNSFLGYNNAEIARRVGEALRTASYLTCYQYENVPARSAAKRLIDIGGSNFSRVLFATSGASANDAAMKLARQVAVLRGERGRNGFIGMHGAWHGLSLGALALTSDSLGQQMYGVDRRYVVHVTPNDIQELDDLLNKSADRIAAVVVEPVLGTGAVELNEAYLARLLEARRAHGILLVADEVTTGFFRTDGWFASATWPEPPDLVICSKGLTNGTMAAAAILVSREIVELFDSHGAVFAHGETQAGTPSTCAAIEACIDEVHRLGVPAAASGLSRLLDQALDHLVEAMPGVAGHQGRGCLRAIELDLSHEEDPVNAPRKAVEAIRDAGALVHSWPGGIQILPAVVYQPRELEELFSCIRRGLGVFFGSTRRTA